MKGLKEWKFWIYLYRKGAVITQQPQIGILREKALLHRTAV